LIGRFYVCKKGAMEVCLPGRCCQTRPDFVAGSTYNTTRGNQDEANSAERVRFLLLGSLAAFQAPEAIAQITFNATAAAAKSTTILQSVDMTGVTSVIKFKFTAGTISTGQLFTMGFCFRTPATPPPPLWFSGEYVVVVPGGGSALAVIPQVC